MQADYRPRGGVKFSTALVDLTSEGACIDTGYLLRERSDGWLHLPTLADWQAQVKPRSLVCVSTLLASS